MHVALMVLVVASDVTVPLSSVIIMVALIVGEEDMERYRCRAKLHKGEKCAKFLEKGSGNG